MMTNRTWVRTVLGVMVGSSTWAAYGQSRVGIRDPNLALLQAESSWAAAREMTTPFLEVVVSADMTCPNLFVGKDKPYRIDTAENRQKLVAAARENGCQIIAFCVPVALAEDSGAEVARMEKIARAAAEMKVPVIMIALGAAGVDQAEFLKRGLAFVKAVAPIARASGVNLSIENVGQYLNRPEVLKPLMEAAPNNEVGLALDVGNLYWFGYPPARVHELAKTFAPHTRYAHAKNIKYPPEQRDQQRTPGWEYGKYAEPAASGDLDFGRILDGLFEAGFNGDITIEGEYLPNLDLAGKKKAITNDAAFLRHLIARHRKASPAPTRTAPP